MAFQRKKPAAIGTKAPYPGFIEPALATAVDKVPSGSRWVHEIKFDGYRVQVHIRDGAVKVFTFPAARAADPAMNRMGRRTIMCMLLMAAIVLVWSVLGR
jgi:hypothetical protein